MADKKIKKIFFHVLLDENYDIVKTYQNVAEEQIEDEFAKIKRIEVAQGRDKYKLGKCEITVIREE